MTDGAPALSKLLWQKRLRGADLTPVEYTVLLTLSTYADRALMNAHPGWTRLASDTRLDVRTIKKAVRSLITKGYTALIEPGGNQYGKGRANVYRLTLPVIHKGDMESTPYPDEDGVGREASGAPRGTSGASEGGHDVYPHQVTTSEHLHHSNGQDHRRAYGDGKESWLDLIDDYDELEAWLDGDLELDTSERSTVLAMWDKSAHPIAIRNTIIASRRRTA